MIHFYFVTFVQKVFLNFRFFYLGGNFLFEGKAMIYFFAML